MADVPINNVAHDLRLGPSVDSGPEGIGGWSGSMGGLRCI